MPGALPCGRDQAGILVGLALLWDRLRGRSRTEPARPAGSAGPAGWPLLLSIFGVIAVVVGIQGLFTPDG